MMAQYALKHYRQQLFLFVSVIYASEFLAVLQHLDMKAHGWAEHVCSPG